MMRRSSSHSGPSWFRGMNGSIAALRATKHHSNHEIVVGSTRWLSSDLSLNIV